MQGAYHVFFQRGSLCCRKGIPGVGDESCVEASVGQ